MVEISAFQGKEHQQFVFKAENSSLQQAAILVHGFPGTPNEMRPLGRILVAMGIDSYGVLLPGFGPDIANLSMQTRQDWLDYLKEFYNGIAKNYRKIILVGYSFGGGLLLNFIQMNSIQPTKVILIAPFWDVFAQYNGLITFFGNLFWPLINKLAPELKPFAGSDFKDPTTRAELERVFSGVDLDDQEIQDTIRQISIPISVIDQLRRIGNAAITNSDDIQQDILILQGVDDQVVPLKQTLKLQSRLANSSIRTIQEADHEMIFAGSDYLRVIRQYIEGFVLQSSEETESVE